MTDWNELHDWMKQPDVREAVAWRTDEEPPEEEPRQLEMELPVIRNTGTVAILISKLPKKAEEAR